MTIYTLADHIVVSLPLRTSAVLIHTCVARVYVLRTTTCNGMIVTYQASAPCDHEEQI